jgi:predicted DNA-binding transcriptional regulator AlpA
MSSTQSGEIPFALANFKNLPDEARVDIDVVAKLFDIGHSTVWSWLKQQRIPQPVREGKTTRWTVGSLRAKLAGDQ